MGKRTEEVPQWVKDFITKRQRQLYEESERNKRNKGEAARLDDDVYLLNPFSTDEVEAIRTGHLAIYPRFSRKDPFFEVNLRSLLLTPSSRQEMQQAVVKHYGWEKWSEDPWGDSQNFYEWLGNIRDKDDTQAIWAINETLAGRTNILTYCTLWALRQLDFSKMTNEDLFNYEGIGAKNFRYAKRYTGWEDFPSHYPTEPLPARLVNKEIIKGRLFWSFNAYISFVVSIYLWYFASAELDKRTKEHPELAPLLSYVTAKDAQLARLRQELAPKGYQFLNENQAWQKLEESLKRGLDRIDKEYKAKLIVSSVTAQGALFDIVTAIVTAIVSARESNAKVSDPYAATLAGLKGWLRNYLLRGVKNDLITAVRQEKPPGRKMAEILKSKANIEPEQEGADYISQEEEQASLEHLAYELDLQARNTFGNTDELAELEEDDIITLKNLELDIDKLTPSEFSAVRRYLQLFRDGYALSEKSEANLKQALGADYNRIKVAFNRAKTKLKKP